LGIVRFVCVYLSGDRLRNCEVYSLNLRERDAICDFFLLFEEEKIKKIKI
jgi:hypothetical protein